MKLSKEFYSFLFLSNIFRSPPDSVTRIPYILRLASCVSKDDKNYKNVAHINCVTSKPFHIYDVVMFFINHTHKTFFVLSQSPVTNATAASLFITSTSDIIALPRRKRSFFSASEYSSKSLPFPPAFKIRYQA